MCLFRSDLDEHNIVRRALSRDVDSVRMNVGSVGISHSVKLAPRIGFLERISYSEVVCVACLHADCRSRHLLTTVSSDILILNMGSLTQ